MIVSHHKKYYVSRFFCGLIRPCNPINRIDSLHDDLLYDILSRLPLSSHSSVAAVCRRWSQIVHHSTFNLVRRQRIRLNPTVFTLCFVDATWPSSFLTVRLTLDDSLCVTRNETMTHPFYGRVEHVIELGRKVFVVNPFRCFVYDPWTGLIEPVRVSMIEWYAVAAVNGKVYLVNSTQVSEYNPKANEWSVVSCGIDSRFSCIGAVVEGVFYVIGGHSTMGMICPECIALCSMELYDVAACVWLETRMMPGKRAVLAACAANGYLYILARRKKKLSFWQFNARRNGGRFGNWRRIRRLPVLRQKLSGDWPVFSCVGLGDKFVMLRVKGGVCWRYPEEEADIVWFFDCVTEDWSQGHRLPKLLQSATDCICV